MESETKGIHWHATKKLGKEPVRTKHRNHLGVEGAHNHPESPDGTLDSTKINTTDPLPNSAAGITMEPTTAPSELPKTELRRPEPYEPGCWASSFACCGIVLLGGALTVACTAGVIDRFISP